MANRSLIASLVAVAMGLAPTIGHSAGLGKLTVLSSLGQPLVGEIELLSVRKEELSSLSARIAPPDAFRDAKVVYSPALVGARVTVERRPGGQPYVRLASSRALEEPYVDVLVELTWSTGRLVRRYTALVDPPGMGPAQKGAPVAVPVGKVAPVPASPLAPAAPAAADTAVSGTYGPVRSGDTLRKIAAGAKPQGVNLDQMLVGIFRSNPKAFIRNNMNLLRTGQILRIPDAAELARITTAEARKEVRAQAADWNAYRQRAAAAAPEMPAGESRAAAGKITTKVEGPGAGAETSSKEVVKVSKGAPGTAADDAALKDRIRVLEEEATAREKTLKDANERVVSLEKTIKDMERLLALKGGAAPAPAATPAPSEPKPEAKVPAEKPPVAEMPAAPKTVAPPAPPPAAQAWWEDPTVWGGALVALGVLGGGAFYASRRRRAEEPEPASSVAFRAPSIPSAGASEAAAAAAAASAAAVVTSELPAAAAQSQPVAEDVDPIAEADVYIAYGRDAQAEEILREALGREPNRDDLKLKLLEIYAARKSKNDFNPIAASLHESTRGQGDTWLKVAGMGFALDPGNTLYAAGKDSAALPQTGAATDVNLDFDLDMVSTTGTQPVAPGGALETGEEVKTTVLSPERMDALRAEGAALADAESRKTADARSFVSDAGAAESMPAAPSTEVAFETVSGRGPASDISLDIPSPAATDSNVIDFEFDPGKTIEVDQGAAFEPDRTAVISPENQEKARDLGVEIDLGASPSAASIPAEPGAEPPVPEPTVEVPFDFRLPDDTTAPPTDVGFELPELKSADAGSSDFSLETVSLDLGNFEKKEPEQPPAPVRDDHWYDVQTKFDLAKAYQEMGDKDGAREILAEVVKEGDAQQQAEANELLSKLG